MIDYTKINVEIQKIKILYRFKKGCCMSFLSTDNSEIREYIKEQILLIDTDTISDNRIIHYDFYENRDKGLEEKFGKLVRKKGNLLLLTGMQDYAEYLKEKGIISGVGDFYMNIFCQHRDNIYLKNEARMIFVNNKAEYEMFLSDYCDDFFSYATYKINIDEMLKENNEKQENPIQTEDER